MQLAQQRPEDGTEAANMKYRTNSRSDLVNGPVLDPTLVGGGVGSGRKVAEGTGGKNEMTNVRN